MCLEFKVRSVLYTSIVVKNQVGLVVLRGKLGVSRACSWRWYCTSVAATWTFAVLPEQEEGKGA